MLLKDQYTTLLQSGYGEFKDRGSKFMAFAYPIKTEGDVPPLLEQLRKEHPKSRHFCYAWRLGSEGLLFRTNDDGEPSSTAGRPILGQIDSANLTQVLVVVVRYFGGTLLGTSGLIEAYGKSAAEAILVAPKQERIYSKVFSLDFDYALQPLLVQTLHKLSDIRQISESYGELGGQIHVSIRESLIETTRLKLKAQLLQIAEDQAEITPWPLVFKEIGTLDTPL